MKIRHLARFCLLIVLILPVFQASQTALSMQPEKATTPAASIGKNVFVANHTNTDVDTIPTKWIHRAKQLVGHYAHTSHGSQIVTGLNWLEATRGSLYNVDIEESTTPHIPDDPTALRIYDGTLGATYVTPDLYWQGSGGMNLTRSVISTGYFDFSEWSWCGEVSYYTPDQVTQYLNAISTFESEFPGAQFILMTGHTEQPVGNTNTNNDLIRAYAYDHNMFLFDFADIESYYPDGTPVPDNLIDDECPWCQSWCDAHPEDCQNFNLMGDCAHTHKLMCSLKAQAYWYLMARMAGWNP